MHDLLDPKLDIVFKLLFTRDHPDSREALLGLLTAVVRPASPLTSVEVLNPEVGRAAVDDKSVVLDIRARLADGTTTNVEMQARNVPPFRTRLLYYWASAFSQQLSAGDGYTTLRPTISVALLSYREPDNPRFHSVFRILETHDGSLYGDALELHLVQLPRLPELTDADRTSEAALLRWTKFFAARSAEELDEAAMDDPAVSKARDILYRLSAEPDARRLAEERERTQKTRRVEDGALREEGRQEGREEGRAEGRQEGRKQELREAILDLCDLIGIKLDAERQAQISSASVEALVAMKRRLKESRAWP